MLMKYRVLQVQWWAGANLYWFLKVMESLCNSKFIDLTLADWNQPSGRRKEECYTRKLGKVTNQGFPTQSPGKILLAHHCLFISNNSLRFYLYQTSDANEKEVSINICTWQSESSKVTYLDFLKFLWKEKKNLKNQKLLQIWAAQGK